MMAYLVKVMYLKASLVGRVYDEEVDGGRMMPGTKHEFIESEIVNDMRSCNE
jgi:hypothetical protein